MSKKYSIGLTGLKFPSEPVGENLFSAGASDGNSRNAVAFLFVLMTAVLSLAAVFSFARAELAEGVTQEQLNAAFQDLSGVYGQSVTTQAQAQTICNIDKYLADCAEIGKAHNLFPEERLVQVDTILDEIKGQVADQIKSCQNIECLVGVAQSLAAKISRENPILASQIDLTPTIVREKKEIVEIAKSAGLTIDQCIEMDPDTAPVELLRGCAKLAKESKVRKYIPTEARTQIDAIVDSTENTAQLKEALAGGQYQCGNNTISGCGDFCLNPGAEARAAGASAIPAICKEIASRFFGSRGVQELENGYSRVSGVADYYYKKAQNSVFITLDGRTLTSPEQIGQYMEQQGRAGNVEAVTKGMDFMIAQGFATQADKDFAVKMVSKFREKGGVADFDVCVQDPKACQDFISDDFQNSFNAMDQVFEIMKQELGFSPDICKQGEFDQSIGQKCLEGSKRALPKIEALASQNPEVMFIVEDIRSHIQRGDQLSQKKEQFISGNFSGPGGCRNERECFVYCSNSVNGPECIAFGSKERLSGFTGEEAVAKYQQYDYSLNRSAIEERYITSGQPVSGPYGDAVYRPGYQPYQPYGQPPYPYYQPYQSPGPQASQTRGITGEQGFGPSPECIRAITSGDFAAAKQVCDVGIGGPVPGQPFPEPPIEPSICPLAPYVQCPAGQYHESFRNNDGCFIDGPCKPIPTYSPGTYPTYSSYPGPGPSYPPGPYPTGPYPSYSPGPGGSSCSKSLISLLGDGCHQMYSDSSGRQVYCDGPMSKSAKEGDSATIPGCSSGVGGPIYSPYPSYTPYPGGWEGQYPGQCSDGVDNDGDGLIDSADTSCITPPIGAGNCPTGYHYHGESGGFCMNDREDYSATCYSADGKTTIKCPSQQTSQCVPPQWWDPARGYCVSSTSPSPWPSPSACPAGYHWHSDSGGYCMNDREDYAGTCYSSDGKTTIKCPSQTYPSPQTCPSGQWWDYARNACISSTGTYSPYPTYSTSPTSGGACPSGSHTMYVNNAGGYCMSDSDGSKCGALNSSSTSSFGSCSSYQTTASYTPVPSCPSGQWWDYSRNACVSSTASYTPYPSCPSGQWWDSVSGTCKSTTSTTYTPYPTTQYTPYPSCPSGQWWDSASNSCQGSTTTYTPYPTTQYTPYPTTEYAPPPYSPPPATYSPPPESSPPPPTSGNLYNHLATLHCAGLDRVWDGNYCQPEGFLARTIENTWANFGKLLGF